MFPASIEYPVNAASRDSSINIAPSIQVMDLEADNRGGSVEHAFEPCRDTTMNTASSDIACRSRTSHSEKSILTNSMKMSKVRSSLATVHATRAIPVISCSMYSWSNNTPNPCNAEGLPVQKSSNS